MEEVTTLFDSDEAEYEYMKEQEKKEKPDVVEVVRCKDCTKGHRKLIRKTDMVECQCYYYLDTRKFKDPMDFCSHGVRKEPSDG